MNNKEMLEWMYACPSSVKWAGLKHNIGKSPEQLWNSCKRADWLFWLALHLEVDRGLVTLAACDCARLALPFVPDGEDRPRLCIEATESFVKSNGTEPRPISAANTALLYAAEATNKACASWPMSGYNPVSASGLAARAAYAASASTGTDDSGFGYEFVSRSVHDVCAAAAAFADPANASAPYCSSDQVARDKSQRGTLAQCVRLIRGRLPWSVIEAALHRFERNSL